MRLQRRCLRSWDLHTWKQFSHRTLPDVAARILELMQHTYQALANSDASPSILKYGYKSIVQVWLAGKMYFGSQWPDAAGTD